jgi:hypothetical protein
VRTRQSHPIGDWHRSSPWKQISVGVIFFVGQCAMGC